MSSRVAIVVAQAVVMLCYGYHYHQHHLHRNHIRNHHVTVATSSSSIFMFGQVLPGQALCLSPSNSAEAVLA